MYMYIVPTIAFTIYRSESFHIRKIRLLVSVSDYISFAKLVSATVSQFIYIWFRGTHHQYNICIDEVRRVINMLVERLTVAEIRFNLTLTFDALNHCPNSEKSIEDSVFQEFDRWASTLEL